MNDAAVLILTVQTALDTLRAQNHAGLLLYASRIDGAFSSRDELRYLMAETVFTAIDHVQLAMPPGEEDKARGFYCNQLGMSEIPKPAALADRGGCWFVSGTVQIHLGVEGNFRAAKKAHPALRCGDYGSLITGLRQAGVLGQDVDDIPGVRRCHIQDPFGNRIELIDSPSKEKG